MRWRRPRRAKGGFSNALSFEVGQQGRSELAFATHVLGASNLPGGYVKASDSGQPLGMEIALVTDDVAKAHAKALAAGAVSMRDPLVKPWGQTVSYVRCPDGTLVELCSPIAT